MNPTTELRRYPSWRFILLTLAIAAFLRLIPLRESLAIWRPDWLALAVFYWALVVPHKLGVGFGWLVGLFEDMLTAALFGQHAIGKALIGMVATQENIRLRQYRIVEQAIIIGVLQAISIGIVVWVERLADGDPIHWQSWYPALSTALMWPMVSYLLNLLDLSPRR